MPPSSRLLPRDPYEARRLENDILGLLLWGPPEQPTLSLGRSDIWDRRWFAERQPLLTLAKIRQLAMADRLSEIMRHPNDSVYDLYHCYDFPCPKPGAQLILGTPFARTAVVDAFPDGILRMTATGDGKSLHADIWVCLSRPLAVVSCVTAGLTPADLWLRMYRHRDTILPGEPVDSTVGGRKSRPDFEPLPAPRACHRGAAFGIVQEFHPEMTFPSGFSAAAMAVVLDVVPEIACHEDKTGLGTTLWAEREGRLDHGTVKRYSPINQAPGAAATASFRELPEKCTIVAAIATTLDGPDPVSEACRTLDEARKLGADGLRDEQREMLERTRRPVPARVRCTRRSSNAAPATATSPASPAQDAPYEASAPPTVIPRLRQPCGYYGDVPLCSVGSTKFWFQDAGIWHNDFHLNEIRAEPMLTLGLFPELLPYCELIHGLLPMAMENARDVYGLPGAMYPLVHYPIRCRGVAHTNPSWEQDMGLNGLVTKPLWLYFRHTGDREFLRDLAYPVLRECARFCRAYASEESDGSLHIFPTVSPEHWGLTARFERNRDCLSALTLTKYLWRAAAAAAAVLRVDGPEAAEWAASARRLAPYPTFDTPDGPVWVDVAGAPPIEYNVPVPLAAVFWGDDVGLDSPPETLALALRTLKQIRIWQPHSFYLGKCIRHRLGVWTEDTRLVPESFLLSYQSIHVFPNVPRDGDIVMENFAAEGGFRVSAVRPDGGPIDAVRILSTLGGPCRMANPWPGHVLQVTGEHGRRVNAIGRDASQVVFETRSGEEYCLRPV